MATTPNFLIPHIVENQAAPEVTANEAFDLMEGAVSAELAVSFATDANTTPTAADVRKAFHLNATSVGSLTATRDLIIPDEPHLLFVTNATTGGQAIQVIGTGTGITIATAKAALVYSDGTNVLRVAADV